MIFRSSQKHSNIKHDNRIAIAVGEEPRDLTTLQAVYSSAHAVEVTDPAQRREAWRLLRERHPNLSGFEFPDTSDAVLMSARCEHVSVLDNNQWWDSAHEFDASLPGDGTSGRS